MPRPKKDNADYFSHDSGMRNDPKIKALRRKYSEGYSVYNMLLEVLTGSNFFSIELTVLNVELLAGDFDIEYEKLTEIIDYCVRIELLIKQENKIYSNGLKNRLQPVIDKRNTAKEKFLLQKPIITNVSVTETTQSKVKESKVKESKEDIVVEEVLLREVEEIFEQKKIEEEKEIPIEFELDEEEFDAALKFLKSHSIFGLTKMQHKLDDTTCPAYFRIFYEQKKAFGELKNKQPIDVLKHFYQWVPKYKRVLTEKNTSNERPKRNQTYQSSNTIQPAKDFGKL